MTYNSTRALAKSSFLERADEYLETLCSSNIPKSHARTFCSGAPGLLRLERHRPAPGDPYRYAPRRGPAVAEEVYRQRAVGTGTQRRRSRGGTGSH